MRTRSLFLTAMLIVTIVPLVFAQQPSASKFGARAPRTCASRQGSISASRAKELFVCDSEKITQSIASGYLLYLVTDVSVDMGKGRPFNIRLDSFPFAKSIDPSQQVFPIRGHFVNWQCGVLGTIGSEPGKSCSKWEQPEAAGICFKDTFADWHCTMTDFQHNATTMERYPPPTGY